MNALASIGNAAGGVVKGIGKFASDFGQGVVQHNRNQLLLRDLQTVEQTTPQNTPARIQQTRSVLQKYGMTMPPLKDAQDQNQYEPVPPVPTPYERAQTQAVEARSRGTPAEWARGLAELDVYEPQAPDGKEYAQDPEGYQAAQQEYQARLREHRAMVQGYRRTAPFKFVYPEDTQDAGAQGTIPGKAGWSWSEEMTPSSTQTPPWMGAARVPAAGAKKSVMPGAQALGKIDESYTRPPAGGIAASDPADVVAVRRRPSLGDALDERRDVMTQYEDAGGVTTSNAQQVARSLTAPTDTLVAAARAIKAYKASPEYVEATKTTGRLLNETDLSGEAKKMLATLAIADQKRLLALIHKHGEKAVLAAATAQAPTGGF